jgi:hypothetical protein
MNDPSEYLGTGRLSWLGDLAPYLPPAFGALIGLRWARHQTAAQKVMSFGLSFGLGVYLGPAVAEILSFGPKAAVAATIAIAVIYGKGETAGAASATTAVEHTANVELEKARKDKDAAAETVRTSPADAVIDSTR